MVLSRSRQDFYRQLGDQLARLTEEARSQSSQEVSDGVTRDWMETITMLQREFQCEVIESLEPEVSELSGRVRSIETEIFRVLKLLATDFLFLKSAKQPPTLRLRHQQFCDRLTAATAYSQAIMTLAQPAEPDPPDQTNPDPAPPLPTTQP
jgi:hypothetical protein